MAGKTSLRITAVALGLSIGTLAIQAHSQGAPAPGYQMAPPAAPGAAPRAPGMRDVFAATLAAVVQTTGVAAASAVSAGLNGAITGWLDKKQRGNYAGTTFYPAQPPGSYGSPPPPPPQGYPGDTTGYPNTGGANPGYPNTSTNPGYPDTGGVNPGYPNTGTNPGYPDTSGTNPGYPNTGYPNTGYPDTGNAGYPNTMPGTSSQGYPNTGGYPNTPGTPGYPSTGDGSTTGPGGVPVYQTPAMPGPGYGTPGASGQLYAGFAYEIHAIGAGGYAQPVDPMTHAFRTGDRFKIVYRPSMPGQVDVYNINAAGQNSQIDRLNVAAGQLAELGPYEFTNMKGNETLVLSLTPCTTPALMTTTRDIVKVPDAMSGSVAGGFQLSQCDATVTRGLKKTKTRDIRKVSVEGGTSFGLDALSATEVRSGDVAPRQITITLQHQ